MIECAIRTRRIVGIANKASDGYRSVKHNRTPQEARAAKPTQVTTATFREKATMTGTKKTPETTVVASVRKPHKTQNPRPFLCRNQNEQGELEKLAPNIA